MFLFVLFFIIGFNEIVSESQVPLRTSGLSLNQTIKRHGNEILVAFNVSNLGGYEITIHRTEIILKDKYEELRLKQENGDIFRRVSPNEQVLLDYLATVPDNLIGKREIFVNLHYNDQEGVGQVLTVSNQSIVVVEFPFSFGDKHPMLHLLATGVVILSICPIVLAVIFPYIFGSIVVHWFISFMKQRSSESQRTKSRGGVVIGKKNHAYDDSKELLSEDLQFHLA